MPVSCENKENNMNASNLPNVAKADKSNNQQPVVKKVELEKN